METKQRYDILDGLRGIAAVGVLVYHIFEAHGLNKFDLVIGHGYLAVDFFFVLSGFVIGYAYDDRWGKMTILSFVKRRILRLHPMVIFGMALGAVLFYFGASTVFNLINDTPVWKMLVYTLAGMALIPIPPSGDIRGWREMYTIDAPAWTLFFEYIANFLYALFIRRLGRTALAVVVGLAACAVIYQTVLTQGDVSGGWEWSGHHLQVGFTRLLYPFFAGLLIYRLGWKIRIKNAFLLTSLLLVAIFAVPQLGSPESLWINGLYEAVVIIVVFPAIVLAGAGSNLTNKRAVALCRLLGDISYPVYLVNYPLVYIYTGYISDTHYSIGQAILPATAVFVGTIAISYAASRWYDKPVRRWLASKTFFN